MGHFGGQIRPRDTIHRKKRPKVLENPDILHGIKKSMDFEAHILGLIGSEDMTPWGKDWEEYEAQLNSDGDKILVFNKFDEQDEPIESYAIDISVRRIENE